MATPASKFQRKPLTDDARKLALSKQTGTRHGDEASATIAPAAPEPEPTPAATPVPALPAIDATEPAPVVPTTPVTAAAVDAPESSSSAGDDEAESAASLPAPVPARRPGRKKAQATAAVTAVDGVEQTYTVRLPHAYGAMLRAAGILVEEHNGDGQKVGVGNLVQMAVDNLMAQFRKKGIPIPQLKVTSKS